MIGFRSRISHPVVTHQPANKRPVRKSIQDYVANKAAKPSDLQLEIKEHCHEKSGIQEDPQLNELLDHPQVLYLYHDEPIQLLDASNYSMVKTPEGKNISVGKGKNAELLLARDETTKQLVAVKVKFSGRLASLVEEFGFQTKAHKILGKNAPSFKGFLQVKNDSPFGVSEGFRYMAVMEFCSLTGDSPVALTVRDAYYMHENGEKLLSKQEWFQICRKIPMTVNTLAKGKLHHCDLKPDNILLRFEGDSVYPVFIDYGMAAQGGMVYGKKETLLTGFSEEDRQKYHVHVPPEMFTQNYLLPTSDLHSAAFCIRCINCKVFYSKSVDRMMTDYMNISPADRPDYKQLAASASAELSLYI